MLTSTATLDPTFRVAPIDRRLFGSFVEHMGRCVYGGIYEPGHPESDVDGYRLDVLKLVRELGVTAVRYPGGNFVSGYRWEDGVGPRAERPRRLDLAWRSVETNEFGLAEFMSWNRLAGTEPMLAVNLGTRGIEAACDLLEYTNHPGGTHLSDLRAAHGSPDPYNVKLWCLGNEMDGPWQIGAKTAEEYGRLAAETAKAMKLVDPSIELVACGARTTGCRRSGSGRRPCSSTPSSTSTTSPCTRTSRSSAAIGRASSAPRTRWTTSSTGWWPPATTSRRRSARGASSSCRSTSGTCGTKPGSSAPPTCDWAQAPRLIEDQYTAVDAVVVGNLLMTLLRHADRVSIACLAQLVNVIAPIRTEAGQPGLAPDHLLPVRVDRPVRRRRRAAGGTGDADLLHGAVRRRAADRCRGHA